MDIQILRDGQQTGPYTEEAVHALLKEGRVLINDLAWRPGLSEWVPLVRVLYPAAAQPAAPAAPEPPAPREPATARQKAFLDYAGIAFAPDVSKEDASRLVSDAMENPKDPARLARWNEERLQLHPGLFAAEIQARKENRSQRFLEICHEQGAAFFEKVTKAHCQVLVAHLDVHFPNWDANEREAATNYFFPALAEKFPQLVTEEGKAQFRTGEKTAVAARPQRSSPVAVKVRPSSGPRMGKVFYAVLRGVFVGFMILGLLWIGHRAFASKTPPVKKIAATAEIPRAASSAETTPKPPPAPAAESKTEPSIAAEKTAEAPAPTAPTSSTPEPAMAAAETKPAASATDLPAAATAPAPGTPELIPPSPARTSVILTKPMQIPLPPYGKISIPAGTTVKIISQNGAALTVRYLDHEVVVPASSTDLGTDRAAPTPRQ